MSAALEGVTVIVTRPASQATPLLEQLRAAGAAVLAWPALNIDPLTPGAPERERVNPERFDWVIYTSANAVEVAMAAWPAPRRPRIAAPGAATARALEAHGLEVLRPAAEASNSEGLLALPAFGDVRGLRILIARGVGGRELLRDTLQQRGADVAVVELYRRSPAAWPADAGSLLRAAKARSAQLVLGVTSVDVLDAAIAAAGPEGATILRESAVLAPGSRIAAAARERGFRGPVIEAPSAEDAAMVAALIDWRNRT